MSITKVGIKEERVPIIGSLKDISRIDIIIILRSILRAVINTSLGL